MVNEPEGTGAGADPGGATGHPTGQPGQGTSGWPGTTGHGPATNGHGHFGPAADPGSEHPGPGITGTRLLDRPGAPPATRGDAWLWVLYGALGFAAGQIIGAILILAAAAGEGHFHQLSHFENLKDQPLWLLAPGLIGLWIGLLLAAFLSSKTRGTGYLTGDLGLRFRLVDLWGIAIGIGSQLAISAVYTVLKKTHVVHTVTGPSDKLLGGSHGWEYAAIALLTVVGAAFFEELFFRGVLFRALARLLAPTAPGPSNRRAWGLVAAVVLDGCLFGLAHWEPVQFVGLAAFGSVLAVITYKTDRLGMNMFAHAAFNAVAVISYAVSSGVVR